MKALALSLAMLVTLSAPVFAVQVKLVTEAESRPLLIGCWTQSPTAIERRFEADGYHNKHTLCFEPEGDVAMSTFSWSATTAHASEASGTYSFADRKLLFDDGEASDGWLFERVSVRCDAMVSNDELQLLNCVGFGPRPSGDQGPDEPLEHLTFRRESAQ